MKKYQFLLLDAGPIIKLFELGFWKKFIKCYDVTIARTVVDEVLHPGKSCSFDYIDYPFEEAAEQGFITIVDMVPSTVQSFLKDSQVKDQYAIDPGEAEALAFLASTSEKFVLCSADGSVFRVLGFLGKGEQGASLEEILKNIGFSKNNLEWKYTKKFCEKYTRMGQVDSIQSKGFI